MGKEEQIKKVAKKVYEWNASRSGWHTDDFESESAHMVLNHAKVSATKTYDQRITVDEHFEKAKSKFETLPMKIW